MGILRSNCKRCSQKKCGWATQPTRMDMLSLSLRWHGKANPSKTAVYLSPRYERRQVNHSINSLKLCYNYKGKKIKSPANFAGPRFCVIGKLCLVIHFEFNRMRMKIKAIAFFFFEFDISINEIIIHYATRFQEFAVCIQRCQCFIQRSSNSWNAS